MKKYILFIVFSTFWYASFAQKALSISQSIDSLNNLLKTAKEDSNKVTLLIKLSTFSNNINPAEALNEGKLALQISKEINWEKGFIKSYTSIANAYGCMSDYPNALKYSQAGVEMAEKIGDKKLEIGLLLAAGNAYWRLTDYAKAVEYYQKALKLSQNIGYVQGEAAILGNLGNVYTDLCNYPKALDFLQQALKANRQLGNKTSESFDLNSIGNIYSQMSDYPNALEQYELSLKISIEIGNKISETSNLSNIGSVYFAIKDYPKALGYFQQGLKLSQAMGDFNYQAIDLQNIGSVYTNLKDYEKAVSTFQQALKIAQSTGNKNSEANVLNNFGLVYIELADYPKAIGYEKEGLKLAKEIGAADLMRDAWKGISTIYEKMHQSDKALDAYKQYITLRDSIVNVDKQKEITRKQMQFGFDTKEAVAKAEQDKLDAQAKARFDKETLQKNAFIGAAFLLFIICCLVVYGYRRNIKQKALLKTKNEKIELLMRELHHRVKNNLQIVSGLLRVQAKSSGQSGTEAGALLREGKNRVEAMSLIHQRLYQRDDITEIDMPEYIRNLVLTVAESFGFSEDKLDLILDVESIDLDAQTAIPIGLIINEVLSNCFKYAYKEINNARMEISMHRKGDNLQLRIADNGAGIPMHHMSGNNNSFGMKMINMLTKQLNGNLEVLNNGGALFNFNFSLERHTSENSIA